MEAAILAELLRMQKRQRYLYRRFVLAMVTTIIGFSCCLIRHVAADDLGAYGLITMVLAGSAMLLGMREARELRSLQDQMASLRTVFRSIR